MKDLLAVVPAPRDDFVISRAIAVREALAQAHPQARGVPASRRTPSGSSSSMAK